MLCQPGASKFIDLIPNHQTRITRFNPTKDLELTVSLGGGQPGKEEPFPLCREGGGIKPP